VGSRRSANVTNHVAEVHLAALGNQKADMKKNQEEGRGWALVLGKTKVGTETDLRSRKP